MAQVGSRATAVGVARTLREESATGKDLRSFLSQLVESSPEQLLVVDEEVDPVFEATAIVDRLRTEGLHAKFPAVLFKHIKGSNIPLILNLNGTYERLALSIDSSVRDMVQEFSRRASQPKPTKRVDRSQAPVKEVILTGEDADLRVLPILQHNEFDAAKYVDSATMITRDPESGVLNAGVFRAQVHGNKELGFCVGPGMNTGYIFWQHAQRKQPLQVAMAIGHHPALLLSATSKPPGIGGELERVGGLMQEPLEVVPAETVDLDVPARAEIVIEGIVDPNPETYREEGPFGEYPRYYQSGKPEPCIQITAITMRRNPIYVDVFNAHDEHLAIGGLGRMGSLLSRIRDSVPTVTAVNLPISGCARLHCYISMKKRRDGEPHLAAFAALATDSILKHVFVVDDDIDVYNEADVLWALATRFQADKDLVTIPNSAGSPLNPVTYGYRRDEKGSLETKLIFDCTKPAPPATFPPATRVPPEVVQKMDPSRFTRPSIAADLA